MKLLCVVLFALVVSAHALGVDNASTKVKCSAFASIKIRQSGSGSCSAQAKADCKAIAQAQDDFAEAYDSWFSEGGDPCDEHTIELAAQACARAVAKVYASALAKVKCKVGKRTKAFACGYSISEGTAMATAMAKAVAQAAVDVSSVDGDGFCYSDVASEVGAFADAAASAQAQACVRGSGSAEDFSAAMIESVADALAAAFVKATAKTCSAEGAASASAECEGKTLADVREDIQKEEEGKAEATGAGGEMPPCGGDMETKCCASDYRRPMCSSGGMWLLIRGATPRSWKKGGGGEKCFCATHTAV